MLFSLDKAVLSILTESRAWKITLGQKVEHGSKDRLKIIIKYISDKEKILSKKLYDLDDLRRSMKCLKNIRDNFLEYVFNHIIFITLLIYNLFPKI